MDHGIVETSSAMLSGAGAITVVGRSAAFAQSTFDAISPAMAEDDFPLAPDKLTVGTISPALSGKSIRGAAVFKDEPAGSTHCELLCPL